MKELIRFMTVVCALALWNVAPTEAAPLQDGGGTECTPVEPSKRVAKPITITIASGSVKVAPEEERLKARVDFPEWRSNAGKPEIVFDDSDVPEVTCEQVGGKVWTCKTRPWCHDPGKESYKYSVKVPDYPLLDPTIIVDP